MRYFPRAPRRLSAALATTVVLIGILAIPAARADDEQNLRDEQRDVQGQIDSTSSALEDSSAAARAADAALQETRAELVGARARLGDVQAELERARASEGLLDLQLEQTLTELATARAELDAGTRATRVQRRELASTVSEIYQRGDPELLAWSSLLQAQTPADLTRQQQFTEAVVAKQDLAYEDLAAAQARLAEQEVAVEEATAALTAQRDAAAALVREVEELQAQAQATETDIGAAVVSRREARRAAAAAREADEARLAELREQEEDVKRQILAAKEAARLARVPELSVASADGLLLVPVDGRVTSPYGMRRHPIYGYYGLHDGTDFGAACGQPLRASGAGTVLTTVYSSSYGNRLFLNLGTINGKNVTVVYNHLSGFAARAGDRVAAGELVGYVGTTGWSTGCHLHFSVLVDGESVDPMTYL